MQKQKNEQTRKKIDWQSALIFALLIASLLVGGRTIYDFFFRMPFVECEKHIACEVPVSLLSESEIIETINELTQRTYEIVWVYNTEYGGRTTLNPFNKQIFLDRTMDANNLVWVYTHEIMHKKLFSANERYVEFQTFKFLYECNIEYFRKVALWRVENMTDNKYNCKHYVLEYLNQRRNN